MMKIVHDTGENELARVFVAELEDGSNIEFVESVQPPYSWREKWVLIVSTLKGCPVGCPICDAGRAYRGRLTQGEIMGQIEHLVLGRFPDGASTVPKLKIQFARMGDPALNPAVLEVLEALPRRFSLPGLMPSISTVAPVGRERFFDELLRIKQELYPGGRFQLQFSVHTTDEQARRTLVPIRTWSLEQMAEFGNRFYEPRDRKITLNFAATTGLPLEPKKLANLFSPERFLVKLTPINPTKAAIRSGLESLIDPADDDACQAVAERFRAVGFETILSIGDLRENSIGSNCGMYVTRIADEETRRLRNSVRVQSRNDAPITPSS